MRTILDHASGEGLDVNGKALSLKRKPNELDETYRERLWAAR
jgi:hypothetical protein